jgi:hypothetical protein
LASYDVHVNGDDEDWRVDQLSAYLCLVDILY